MALVKCHECGKELSDSAVICPHCGAPSRSTLGSKRVWLPVLGGVLAVLVIGMVAPALYFDYREKEKIELLRLRELQKPDIPVEVTFRKAITGPGLVVAFSNNSSRHLALAATLRNPSLNIQKTLRIDVGPGQVREIGHLERWTTASGDTIELSHNEYKKRSFRIP